MYFKIFGVQVCTLIEIKKFHVWIFVSLRQHKTFDRRSYFYHFQSVKTKPSFKKKKNILQLNKSGTVKKLPLDLLEEELLPGEHKNS